MTTCNIILETGEHINPDLPHSGWWVDFDARRITVRTDLSLQTYTLPRGSRRVTTSRLGGGRAQLALGGFTSTTVCVTGPSDIIDKLREACLA